MHFKHPDLPVSIPPSIFLSFFRSFPCAKQLQTFYEAKRCHCKPSLNPIFESLRRLAWINWFISSPQKSHSKSQAPINGVPPSANKRFHTHTNTHFTQAQANTTVKRSDDNFSYFFFHSIFTVRHDGKKERRGRKRLNRKLFEKQSIVKCISRRHNNNPEATFE